MLYCSALFRGCTEADLHRHAEKLWLLTVAVYFGVDEGYSLYQYSSNIPQTFLVMTEVLKLPNVVD